MNSVIPTIKAIFDNEEVNAVDARELYKALGLNISHFARWAKMSFLDPSTGFATPSDFVTTPVDNLNPARYLLSLDTAKHLAMLTKTETGYKVRRYFIEVEKRARAGEKTKCCDSRYMTMRQYIGYRQMPAQALNSRNLGFELTRYCRKNNIEIQRWSDFAGFTYNSYPVVELDRMFHRIFGSMKDSLQVTQ